MAFPGAIPSYAGFTSGHTLLTDAHASQHNLEQADISALGTKIGTGASTPTSGMVLRGNGVGTSAWGQVVMTTDVTGVLPQANGGNGTTLATGTGKAVYDTAPTISGASLTSPTITNPTITNVAVANVTALLGLIYPVGCIYTDTTGTNPATTFGFGTWIAFGGGRVLLGNGTSDATYAAGATGGGSTKNLAHTHAGTTDAMSNLQAGVVMTSGAVAINHTHAFTTGSGGSATQDVMNPYIVVYFWQRTA